MGDIVDFVSKSDRERIRLIQEARAVYDSVFPSNLSDGRPDRAPANNALRDGNVNDDRGLR
jgi:hypothetical protein